MSRRVFTLQAFVCKSYILLCASVLGSQGHYHLWEPEILWLNDTSSALVKRMALATPFEPAIMLWYRLNPMKYGHHLCGSSTLGFVIFLDHAHVLPARGLMGR
jgi:hypothetical protein